MKFNIDNRKTVLGLGFLSIALITLGVTYAFFSYIGSGTTENTVSSDTITFLYDEVDKQGSGISISDALPMSDEAGKAQTVANSFDFRIASTTGRSAAIPYEITLRKKTGSNDLDDIIKVYLAKTTDNTTLVENEQQVVLSKYTALTDVTHNGHVEKILYNDYVPANSDSYNQGYRFKMWIDSAAPYGDVTTYYCGETAITQEQYEDATYVCPSGEKNTKNENPYFDKTFSVTVNVYANGRNISNGSLYSANEIYYLNNDSTNCTSTPTVECALNELADRYRP